MINGMGELKDVYLVATSFNKNTNGNTYQVHSHRNPENFPIENEITSNLYIGKKGFLKTVTLYRDGFHSQQIKIQKLTF
ncbi:MAG TPA: hypothetical protein VN414_12860 [Methanosarcina sp.]|nr:hypothetical protein [Methanosarcina sp.]